jgi:ParB family chromosome partitioning protein
LSEKLGAVVNIHQKNKGKGRLEISYSSLDELEGILSHIH